MKNIKVETIIRTVCYFMALINQVLFMFGKSPIPIDDESITGLITISATVITGVWAWWKNNSFTPSAIKADEYLEVLREKEEV